MRLEATCIVPVTAEAPHHAHCLLLHGLRCCHDAGVAPVSVRDVITPTVEWLVEKEEERRGVVLRTTLPRWPVSRATHL